MTDQERKLKWVDWAMRLQALAQNGQTYNTNPYDLERYAAVQKVAAEMLALGSGMALAAVNGLLQDQQGYATPKVDVRGVVFRGDELLMVREVSDGKWSLPGGWADIGESPSESVVREVLDESGFETRATKLLALFDRARHPHEPPFAFHVYKLFFRCDLLGGQAKISAETDAVDFFPEDELPPLSISRITPGQIHRLFEHHRNPDLPTGFD